MNIKFIFSIYVKLFPKSEQDYKKETMKDEYTFVSDVSQKNPKTQHQHHPTQKKIPSAL